MRYRRLQSAFSMEDFSSKGSRLISLKRVHRNQLAGTTEESPQPGTGSNTHLLTITHTHSHTYTRHSPL